MRTSEWAEERREERGGGETRGEEGAAAGGPGRGGYLSEVAGDHLLEGVLVHLVHVHRDPHPRAPATPPPAPGRRSSVPGRSRPHPRGQRGVGLFFLLFFQTFETLLAAWRKRQPATPPPPPPPPSANVVYGRRGARGAGGAPGTGACLPSAPCPCPAGLSPRPVSIRSAWRGPSASPASPAGRSFSAREPPHHALETWTWGLVLFCRHLACSHRVSLKLLLAALRTVIINT